MRQSGLRYHLRTPRLGILHAAYEIDKSGICRLGSLQLLVDDFLIYNGVLEQFSPGSRSYNTIMFSTDEGLISREKHTIIKFDFLFFFSILGCVELVVKSSRFSYAETKTANKMFK